MDRPEDRTRPEHPTTRHAAKTTIVGGQPPGNARDVPPVPVGLEHLLYLAATHETFAAELIARREAVAEPARVTLTANEQAMLHAVPDVALRQMISRVHVPDTDRRGFLEHAAWAVAAMVGGSVAASCDKPKSDAPARERGPEQLQPQGIRPDLPMDAEAPGRTVDAGGASVGQDAATSAAGPDATSAPPERPRPEPMGPVAPAGILSRPRPADLPVSDGIRPDHHPMTRGIRPDRPIYPSGPKTGSRPDRTDE